MTSTSNKRNIKETRKKGTEKNSLKLENKENPHSKGDLLLKDPPRNLYPNK